MSPTFAVDLIIGLPTIEGKMWAGKLEPANPHLTNYKKNNYTKQISWRKEITTAKQLAGLTPVPLSQTITLLPLESMAVPSTDHFAENKMAATNFLNALSRDWL